VQNETLIAIKAPHGTTLEVPDPDEVGSIKINEFCIHKLLTVFYLWFLCAFCCTDRRVIISKGDIELY
jgi:hypothetical protein